MCAVVASCSAPRTQPACRQRPPSRLACASRTLLLPLQACPPGSHCPEGASAPTACPVGYFSSGLQPYCTLCETGWTSDGNATACYPCPPGEAPRANSGGSPCSEVCAPAAAVARVPPARRSPCCTERITLGAWRLWWLCRELVCGPSPGGERPVLAGNLCIQERHHCQSRVLAMPQKCAPPLAAACACCWMLDAPPWV